MSKEGRNEESERGKEEQREGESKKEIEFIQMSYETFSTCSYPTLQSFESHARDFTRELWLRSNCLVNE